jgi:hypothetical protein
MYPSVYDKTDSTYISLFSGSLTITKGADGDEITGALLGWNNTEYTLDLRTKVPASVGIISTAPKKKAVKRFLNGQIIIEIEGKSFSLTGAELQ